MPGKLSYFGKERYTPPAVSEAALNAGVARSLSISTPNLDNYGPFVRLHVENKSAVTIAVYLDGQALGDNSINGAKEIYYVPPLSALDVTPYPDGTPDKVFSRAAIKNLDGVSNTAAGDIVTRFSNV